MPSPLTDARNELLGILKPLGYRVYANPVEVPAPPCIQIFTEGVWLTRSRVGKGHLDVRLNIRVSVPTKGGTAEALDKLEQMVWEVANAVVVLGDVRGPALDISSQTESYVVDIAVLTTI